MPFSPGWTGKVAFCFPGQGSLEVGMGREIAEAVPEAMEVYRIGSEVDGHGPRAPVLRGAARGARRDRGAAADARRDEPRDPRRRAQGGIEPDVVVGHSVGEFAALASVGAMSKGEAIGLVRERGLAMAEAARAAPRRDGGDPRSRGPARRDALPEDPRGLAGELQLPGPDRRLGGERRGRGVLRRGREPRRATSDPAQGLGRVPQPARRRRRAVALKPAIDRIRFARSRSRRSCRP